MKIRHDEKGREICDSTPVEVPLDFKTPPSIHQLIAQYVRSERAAEVARAAGVETFEEADDFDVGDEDELPLGGAELSAMHEQARLTAEDAEVLDGRKAAGKPPAPGSSSKGATPGSSSKTEKVMGDEEVAEDGDS